MIYTYLYIYIYIHQHLVDWSRTEYTYTTCNFLLGYDVDCARQKKE